MDNFEKVEKLREKANVSYEEAKAALEEANGDLLDAMIILEKAGKSESHKESHSTKAEDDDKYAIVPAPKKEKREGKTKIESFFDKIRALWRKSCENYFVVERKGDNFIKLPIWLFILILLIAWEAVIVVLILALFLGCKYSFKGAAEMKLANNVMDKASAAADKVKEEFDKL